MSLIKCPECGELFSDSYKSCPFCAEDEEFYQGTKAPKSQTRRQVGGHREKPSIVGPVMVLVVLLLAGLVTFMFFGDKITAFFSGEEKPPVEDPVDPTPDPNPDPAPTLTLDKTELALKPGETAKLTATVAEGVTWSCSDPEIVSIGEDGTVTALSAGTVTVTAMTPEASAACRITVSVPVEDLRLKTQFGAVEKEGSKFDTTMTVGERYEMSIDGTDAKVSWSIGNSSVATISDSGVLEAVDSGTTTLKATVMGQTIECIVRVKD